MRQYAVGLLGCFLFLMAGEGSAQINAQLASPLASDYHYVTPDALLGPRGIAGAISLGVDYSHLPLLVSANGANPEAVISDLVTTNLALRLNWLKRFRLEATLPLNMDQSTGVFSRNGLGDGLVSFQTTFLDPEKHILGLALRPILVIPSGDPDQFFGEGSLSPGVQLVVQRQGRWLTATTALGALFVQPYPVPTVSGDRLIGSLALSAILSKKFRLGAEIYGNTELAAPFQDADKSPLEVLATARYELAPGISLKTGAGTGVSTGVGASRFRAFFQLAMSLPGDGTTFRFSFQDRDRDGLADNVDGCPTEPEDPDGFRDEDGCPDPDNDADGIADGDDQCPDVAEDRDGFLDRDGCPEADNDEDGIADGDDRCPNSPEDYDQILDQDGCPEDDADQDGFFDVEDECPLEKEDFDGYADLDGCPEMDNDGDGLADAEDACPDEGEDFNGVDDGDGCPDATPEETVCIRDDNGDCVDMQAELPINRRLTLSDPILFALDSADLSPTARKALDLMVPRLLEMAENIRLRIVGHCDDRGTDEYNDWLSIERASTVKTYLMARGVSANKLETDGFGRRQPLVPGFDEEARSRNRRVEMWVLKDDTPEQVQISRATF